jgi:hypothetical protein
MRAWTIVLASPSDTSVATATGTAAMSPAVSAA